MHRDREPDESGVTLVEMAVAMFITALLATVMIVWLGAVFGADTRQASYDEALNDLRDVSDRLSRDLRGSQELIVADATTMTFWLDTDRDGSTDVGELITWTIETDGTVTRSTDAGITETVLATKVVPGSSSFAYDETLPIDVARVTVSLVARAETGNGITDDVMHSSDILLRNA